ncbi:MFS transporter [Pullulanibacillus camelliae]|uniref:MFS transporter n=1 Tax=Pullulanibacillus camelliae TaxID=1707096 RepID=A0A8J2YBD6_9BACL|nr:MFS transporter [Pullulanibacillus camelliae]GGE27695.1 MFS transporter [Pullulanibacillus camelliae]
MNNVEMIEKSTMKKVKWRILPFVFLLYIISFIDRGNIGYAALDMNTALGISSTVFGLLSGIFFIGYFLFEVPSNILLHRLGAKIWISRILISWGIIVMLTTWVKNVEELYILRFLLGIAEAGLFPGIILYLTYWFPAKDQARAVALFMLGIPVSNIISGPLSTWIMSNVHGWGLEGWQWLFFWEGLPAVVIGIIAIFFLVDRPEKAKWLSKEEKHWLANTLENENKEKLGSKKHSITEVLKIPKVWRFSIIYLTVTMGSYAISLWMPTIVSLFSKILTDFQVGLISIIPFIFGGICMMFWSKNSDRTGERRFHTSLPPLFGAIGLVISATSHSPIVMLIGLTMAAIGIYCFFGPFWPLPNAFLSKEMAAVGLAVINSIGNIGGFLGPYAIGYLKDATGSVSSGLYFLCGGLILGFLLTVTLPKTSVKASGAHVKDKRIEN